MRISDWSSDVCSSDLMLLVCELRVSQTQFAIPASEFPVSSMLNFCETLTPRAPSARPIPFHQCLSCRRERGRSYRRKDRKSVVLGKRVSVRVDLGGRSTSKKKSTRTVIFLSYI